MTDATDGATAEDAVGPDEDAVGPDEDDAAPECVAIGGAMVDVHYAVSNLPEPDGGAYASDVERTFGGVGSNVAVALDRLGRDAGLVSRVGDDPTTYSVILRDPDGERMIVTTGESFREFRLDRADRRYLADAEVVFLTAYAPDPVASAVLDRAGDPEFPAVAFDCSGPVEELLGRGTSPATIHGFLHAADLFVVDEVAAASVFGADPAARVAAAEPARAVLTRGADGGTVVVGDERTEYDAFDVDVVDTTGAGDSFVAGLIDRWLLGDDGRSEAVRFASAVAAINCTERFAQPGLPTGSAVESFLARRS